MTSRAPRKRVRKTPGERRAEIIATAAAIALTEGLEVITLRRVADDLGVRSGLISHYFPAVEDLVAEAFGVAAENELDTLLPADTDTPPLERLTAFFDRAQGESFDDISRLWINARHLSRYRPLLRGRVERQEATWRDRLESTIRAGIATGDFRTPDPYVSAIRILVVIDGLGAHANTHTGERPPEITRMARTTAEHELGLPRNALTRTTTDH